MKEWIEDFVFWWDNFWFSRKLDLKYIKFDLKFFTIVCFELMFNCQLLNRYEHLMFIRFDVSLFYIALKINITIETGLIMEKIRGEKQ